MQIPKILVDTAFTNIKVFGLAPEWKLAKMTAATSTPQNMLTLKQISPNAEGINNQYGASLPKQFRNPPAIRRLLEKVIGRGLGSRFRIAAWPGASSSMAKHWVIPPYSNSYHKG